MKVLSILQPWASLVVTGHKTIETRTWIPKNPEIIKQLATEGMLIHAGAMPKNIRQYINNARLAYKILDKYNAEKIKDILSHEYYGAIIGKVKVKSFFEIDDKLIDFMKHSNSDNARELECGYWINGNYGWLFSEPILFNTPIPAKGQLNLWNFDIEKYNESPFQHFIDNEL